jgi:autotransporter-associated beta strand protein
MRKSAIAARRYRVRSALVLALAVGFTSNTIAADLTWTGATNDNWSTVPSDINWTTAWSNNVPRSLPHKATFDLASPDTVNVTGNIDVGAITFSTGGWDIASGGGVLAYGSTGTLVITSTTGTNTINATIANGSSFGSAGGTTSLLKAGDGTLILGGANTYTGNTSISAGVLQLGASNALSTAGTVTVASGNSTFGTLDLHGFNQSVAALGNSAGTLPGRITNQLASTTSILSVTGNSNGTFSGNILDGAGAVALSKSGTGTLTLAAHNSFSGPTTINAGTITVLSTGSLLNTPITIATDGKLIVSKAAGSNAATSSVSPNSVALSGGTLNLLADVSAGNFLAAGSSGGNLLIDVATGYTAGGTNAIDFSSMTGSIRLGVTSTFATTAIASTVNFIPDATTHTLRFGAGLGTLQVNSILADVGPDPTYLDVTGAGRLTLAGNSTYTGATTINGSTVTVTHANGLGAISGTTLLNAGTLNLNAASAEAITIAGGTLNVAANTTGTVTINGGTTNINAASSSALTMSAGTLNINAATNQTLAISGGTANIKAAFAGPIAATGGIVSVQANGSIGAGQLTLSGGTLALGINVNFAPMLDAASTGGTIAINTLNFSGAANTINFATIPGGANMRLGTTGTGSISSSTVLTPDATSFTLRFGGGSAGTLTYNGIIADVGPTPTHLDFTGLSKTILGGTSTFTGAVTINSDVQLTTASALGAGTGIDANGTTVNAGGKLTATGITLLNEKITVNGGSLNVISNGPVTVSAPSTLEGTYRGVISGAGDITFNGTTSLTGANDYTGQGFVGAGATLTISTSAGTLGSTVAGTTVTIGGTLNLNTPSAESITVSGGTLTIAANTTGAVSVSSGTVNLNNASAAPITLTGGLLNVKAASSGGITATGSSLVRVTTGGSFAANSLQLSGGTFNLALDLNISNIFHPSSTGGPILIDVPSFTAGGSNIIDFSSLATGFRLGSSTATGSLGASVSLIPDTATHTIRFGSGSASATLTVPSVIADVNATPTHLDFAGTGKTTLSGNNTFTGTASIASPVTLLHVNALGAGTGVDADGTTIHTGGTLTTTLTLLNEKITLSGGTANLNTNGPVHVSAASTIAGNFAGPITGSGNLTVGPAGATLSGISNFSGQVTLSNSTLMITSTASLVNAPAINVNGGTLVLSRGAGNDPAQNSVGLNSVILNAGTLALAGDVNIAAILNSASTGGAIAINTTNFTAGGSNSIDFSSLPGGSSLRLITTTGGSIAATLAPDAVTHTLRFGGPGAVGTLEVLSSIADANSNPTALDLQSGGTTKLSAASTYTGVTSISGTLIAAHNSALGAGTGADSDATIVNTGGTLTTTAGVTLANEKIIVNGGTINVSTIGPVFMLAAGNLAGTFNGEISGAAAVTFNGPATLAAANTYTAATTIANGATVNVNHAQALGDTVAGTTVQTGGILNINANSPEFIVVSGGTLNLNAFSTGSATLASGTLNLNVTTNQTILVQGGVANINAAPGSPLAVAAGEVILNVASAQPVAVTGGIFTINAAQNATTTITGGLVKIGTNATGTGVLNMSAGQISLEHGGANPIVATGGVLAYSNTDTAYAGSVSVTNTEVRAVSTTALGLATPITVGGNTSFTANSTGLIFRAPGLTGTGTITTAANFTFNINGPLNFQGNLLTNGTTQLTSATIDGKWTNKGNATVSSSLQLSTPFLLDAGSLNLNGTAQIPSAQLAGTGILTINGSANMGKLTIATLGEFSTSGLFGAGTLTTAAVPLEFLSGNFAFTGTLQGATEIRKTSTSIGYIRGLPSSFAGAVNVVEGELQLIGGSTTSVPINLAPTGAVLTILPGSGAAGTYTNPISLNSAQGANGVALQWRSSSQPFSSLSGQLDLGPTGATLANLSTETFQEISLANVTGGTLRLRELLNITLDGTTHSLTGIETQGGVNGNSVRIKSVLTNLQSISLGSGGKLIIDNSLINLPDRIPDSAAISLSGATLVLEAKSGSNVTTSETVGALTLSGGLNMITVRGRGTTIGNTVNLTVASLQANPGAILNFEDLDPASGNGDPLGGAVQGPHFYITGQAPTSFLGGAYTYGTIANATSTVPSFVKYTAAGATALVASDYFTGPESAWTPTTVAGIPTSTTATLTASRDVNAIYLHSFDRANNGTTTSLAIGANTLNVISGAIMTRLHANISGAPGGRLTAGGTAPSANLYFHSLTNGAAINVSVDITDNPGADGQYDPTPGGPLDADNGSLSVVFGGRDWFTITGNSSYTGTTYLSGPPTTSFPTAMRVTYSSPNSIPTGPIVINVGNLIINGAFTANTGALTVRRGTVAGTASINAPSYLVDSGTLSSPLVGAGPIVKNGSAAFVIGGPGINNLTGYTGPITVLEGSLTVPVKAYANTFNVQNATLNIQQFSSGTTSFTGNVTLGDNAIISVPSTNFTLNPSSLTLGNRAMLTLVGQWSVGGSNDPFTDTANSTRHLNITMLEDNRAGVGGLLTVTAGTKNIGSYVGSGLDVNAGAVITAGTVVAPGGITSNGAFILRSGTPSTDYVGLVHLSGSSNAWTGKVDITDNNLIIQTNEFQKTKFLASALNQVEYGRTHDFGIYSSTLTPDMMLILLDNGELAKPFVTFGGHIVDRYSLLVLPVVRGDANLDGVVNFSDFIILSQNFGKPGSYLEGNFAGNGTVDFSSFVILSQNFGKSAPWSSSLVTSNEIAAFTASSEEFFRGGAVPEPTTLALLLPSLLLLPRRRQRR